MTQRFPRRRAPARPFAPQTVRRTSFILLIAWLLAAWVPGGTALAQGAGGGRVALVVGVGGYAGLPPLPGAVADAGQVAAQLQALGYAVTTLTDPDRAGFDVALAVFARQAEGADAAVLYFAGHALGAAGATRLALVDSRLASPADAPGQTFPLEAAMARLALPGRPAAILIDARTEALAPELQGPLVQPSPTADTLLALAEGGSAGFSAFAQGWLAEVAAAGTRPEVTVDAILADLGARLGDGGKGRVRLTFVSTLPAPLALVPPPAPVAPPVFAVPQPDATAAAPAGQPPVFMIPRFGEAAPADPAATPEEVVVVIPDDLPTAVQTELARTGCYTRRVDGVWGPGSRAALAEFGRRSNRPDLGDEPTAEVWLVVQAARGVVCPPPAEPVIRGTTHAAIAFSRATFIAPEGASTGWGLSSNRPSAQVAAGAAIRDCNNGDPTVTDCRVVLSFVGGCGALAVGGSGNSVAAGAGRGATEAAARNAAVADCRRRAGSCRAVAAICTP